jgi:hypothetical protein
MSKFQQNSTIGNNVHKTRSEGKPATRWNALQIIGI